jgi:hypothetical protein
MLKMCAVLEICILVEGDDKAGAVYSVLFLLLLLLQLLVVVTGVSQLSLDGPR